MRRYRCTECERELHSGDVEHFGTRRYHEVWPRDLCGPVEVDEISEDQLRWEHLLGEALS